jgi:hypothetical protein
VELFLNYHIVQNDTVMVDFMKATKEQGQALLLVDVEQR